MIQKRHFDSLFKLSNSLNEFALTIIRNKRKRLKKNETLKASFPFQLSRLIYNHKNRQRMSIQHPFPEAFLHYIWKLKLFNFKDLKTVDQEPIELLHIGWHNHHAGPDFSNARIRIGETLWAGSVEIHKKSSDWLLHQHQYDEAYNNTILHVVYEYDCAIHRSNGECIPTVELKTRIDPRYIQRYWTLLNNNNWIPCERQLVKISFFLKNLWLDHLVVKRLERKVLAIDESLQQTNNNWEETFYRFLANNFGVKENKAPFEALAKSLPLLVLAKHKHSLFQLEALLLGQAGLLSVAIKKNKEDRYLQKCYKEYTFLAKKYGLYPIKAASWKFGRMRPANFPTIRLAQFATLIHQSTHLFSRILEEENPKKLRGMFELKLQGYWDTHYLLGESTSKRNKSLGDKTIDLLLINTIAPFLFVFGQYKGIARYKERAIELLQILSPEKNSIVENWNRLGIVAKSAYETQGLLELKKEYCQNKQCLNCQIGHQILKIEQKIS